MSSLRFSSHFFSFFLASSRVLFSSRVNVYVLVCVWYLCGIIHPNPNPNSMCVLCVWPVLCVVCECGCYFRIVQHPKPNPNQYTWRGHGYLLRYNPSSNIFLTHNRTPNPNPYHNLYPTLTLTHTVIRTLILTHRITLSLSLTPTLPYPLFYFCLLLFCHSFLCLRLCSCSSSSSTRSSSCSSPYPIHLNTKVRSPCQFVFVLCCVVLSCCVELHSLFGLVLSWSCVFSCKAVSPVIFNWIFVIQILQDINNSTLSTLHLIYITVKFTC